jgi:hypothetical protein
VQKVKRRIAFLVALGHSNQSINVTLSDEAAEYFKRKGCAVELEPTPPATRAWNNAKGAVIGLFHVTC